MIAYAYAEKGSFAEAINELDRPFPPESMPWIYAMRAYVYGRCGRTAEAQKSFLKMQEALRQQPWEPPLVLVSAYLGLNEKDKTIALLQKAYSEHSQTLVFLKVEPIVDPLRSDPRFQELLRQVHLAD